jgi:hypothetical protein
VLSSVGTSAIFPHLHNFHQIGVIVAVDADLFHVDVTRVVVVVLKLKPAVTPTYS